MCERPPMRPSPTRNFQRRIAVTAYALLLLFGAPSVDAALLCSQSLPAIAVLDPSDSHAALAAITVDCSGGAVTDPTVSANVQIFFAATLLTDVLPTLSDGFTTYTGVFSGSNSAIFLGVPIVPLATTLKLRDFFIDATLFASGFGLTEFLSITSTTAVPVSNSTLLVALVGEPTTNVAEPGTLLLLATAGAIVLGLRLGRRRGDRASRVAA